MTVWIGEGGNCLDLFLAAGSSEKQATQRNCRVLCLFSPGQARREYFTTGLIFKLIFSLALDRGAPRLALRWMDRE